MLQRHVDIRQDSFTVSDHIQQFLVDVHRVKVHEPNPVQPFDLVQFDQQLGQTRFAVQVHPVVGRVLGHDDQLADTLLSQLFRFGDYVLNRFGGVLASHLGDRAECAKSITTL